MTLLVTVCRDPPEDPALVQIVGHRETLHRRSAAQDELGYEPLVARVESLPREVRLTCEKVLRSEG
eukprot:CAMPEP_0174887680 /NCGR_PEP_ID=MMETSP0167-20121228/2919_1 /TAXON_ID=38298 /ORGANISM="Rhodella maculata, Strain CCMP736" /LENGTH=65 /DNA_ID=CAMNT_0016124257 /DNA_START=203 /DNA_END=397 /DNA_ORIENTATION=+